jgi:hypothetical protein
MPARLSRVGYQEHSGLGLGSSLNLMAVVMRADLKIAGVSVAMPLAALIVWLALSVSSCGKKNVAAAQPAVPPPIAVIVPVDLPADPVSEPQTAAELPVSQPIPAGAVPDPLGPLASREESSPPEVLPPPEQAPRVGDRGGESAPAESVALPLPRLGQILSTEERRTYDQLIDRSIERAQRSLAFVLGHSLRPDQAAAVRRIRAFIEQAGAARDRDLALAKNMADRALLLAEDLERSFR